MSYFESPQIRLLACLSLYLNLSYESISSCVFSLSSPELTVCLLLSTFKGFVCLFVCLCGQAERGRDTNFCLNLKPKRNVTTMLWNPNGWGSETGGNGNHGDRNDAKTETGRTPVGKKPSGENESRCKEAARVPDRQPDGNSAPQQKTRRRLNSTVDPPSHPPCVHLQNRPGAEETANNHPPPPQKVTVWISVRADVDPFRHRDGEDNKTS